MALPRTWTSNCSVPHNLLSEDGDDGDDGGDDGGGDDACLITKAN